MDKIFNFDELSNHDLYHLRFGRAAVIVAVPREDPAETGLLWDKYHEALAQEVRQMMEPRKKEIEKRLIELKCALTSLDMARRGSGLKQDSRDDPDSDETRIRTEIETLKLERGKPVIPSMTYRSYLQLAMFYSHNISAKSDTDIRFDRVLEIAESSTHLTLSLQFIDRLSDQHQYHHKISYASGGPRCLGYGEGSISGVVKRVLPIESVTLEVVSRPEFQVEDIVRPADLDL